MSNRKSSKTEMKQIYLIRRVVAVVLFLLVFVLIFTMCGKKNNKEDASKNNSLTIVPENNVNTQNEPTTPEIQTKPNDTLEDVLKTNEKQIQADFEKYATVTYNPSDKCYLFTFNEEYKDVVLKRDTEEGKEAFKLFWENFTFELKKTSETLADTVEPGIEIQVMSPEDENSAILFMQDGTVVFDRTSDQ